MVDAGGDRAVAGGEYREIVPGAAAELNDDLAGEVAEDAGWRAGAWLAGPFQPGGHAGHGRSSAAASSTCRVTASCWLGRYSSGIQPISSCCRYQSAAHRR